MPDSKHGQDIIERHKKKAALAGRPFVRSRKKMLFGNRLGYRTGPNAPGTHGHLLHLTRRKLYPNLLQIGHETAFALVVCMTDVVSDLGLFPTDCAFFRHYILLE